MVTQSSYPSPDECHQGPILAFSRRTLALQGMVVSYASSSVPPRPSNSLLRVFMISSHALPVASHLRVLLLALHSSIPKPPLRALSQLSHLIPQCPHPEGTAPITPQVWAEPNPSPQAHEERHPSLGQNPFIAQMRCGVCPVLVPEARSQILHPASPGRQQSHGKGLQKGERGAWQKWMA